MNRDEGDQVRVSRTLDRDTSFLLARAGALVSAAGNRALADLGLKVRTYAVLALAVEAEPSQRDLAEKLRLDPSQIVSLVDTLAARGVVERRQDPADRRSRTVVATPDGLALFERARVLLEAAHRELHSHLPDQEAEALRGLLHRIAFVDLD